MKRLVLTLMGVVVACISAMAQTSAAASGSPAAGGTTATAAPVIVAPAAATAPAKAVDMSKVLTGTLDSVTAADAVKNIPAKVVVRDETGLKYPLIVKGTTTIYNDKSEAVSFDHIVAGQKVHVKYNGANEAVSIRVVPSVAPSAAAAPSAAVAPGAAAPSVTP